MTDSRSPWVGEAPKWDEDGARALFGTRVIIGVTTLYANGELHSQTQMHGRITIADAERGICVALEGKRAGEIYWLPPQIESFEPAKPGEYRLRSTGELIVDPDYTSSWTITKPQTS
jgi:hypothetical protein